MVVVVVAVMLFIAFTNYFEMEFNQPEILLMRKIVRKSNHLI